MQHLRGRYIEGNRAQIPLRITEDWIKSATYLIDNVYANSGYQGQNVYQAAKKWTQALYEGHFVWLGISGAATPVGLGGLIADAIRLGLADVIVSTGANTYHDLHFAFGLPVRHGSAQADDNDLRRDGTTRIYTQFIDNTYTLKMQDAINQFYTRRVLPRLADKKFSSATFLYELGMEMLADEPGLVVDRRGSFVITAAEFDLPIYWDSDSNHSLAMDLGPLFYEGMNSDTTPRLALDELAGFVLHNQPQLNIFFGEGGPKNKIQTIAPYVNEVGYIPFEGSDSSITFTISDERAGALSGSKQPEAVTWGKYEEASPDKGIEVWTEYTIAIPLVIGYVAGHAREPRRLMHRRDEFYQAYIQKMQENTALRRSEQERLMQELPEVQRREIEARRLAGYNFEE